MLEGMLWGGLIGVFLVIWFISKLVTSASDEKKANRENAPEILDDVFNGDPVVSYEAGFTGLDQATVIKGGIERGYELHSQHTTNRSYGVEMLTFKKV